MTTPPMSHRFSQVDVFGAAPLLGNPVAVVHDAAGLDDEQMAAFARWTNLSETTFLLPPSDPAADYRVRIFTPESELPFAGHPTLGSAHAWLEADGLPRTPDRLVQECGVGLVELTRDTSTGRLAFVAPPLVRSGPVEPDLQAKIVAGLRVRPDDVVDLAWIDNGPGWIGVLLNDAETVLALEPDPQLGLTVGVAGPYAAGSECALEVRAFVAGLGIAEDPVTGSLNAGLAQWLAGNCLPASYVASQGTRLGRAGRVHVEKRPDGLVLVGGDTTTILTGRVTGMGQPSA